MRSNNNISRWTGVLFRRYLRQCTLWAAVLIVCGGLFDIIIQIMPMYYQAEFYLRYRSLYTACVCVAIWTVIVLVLTWRLVRRAASYIDEVQEAAHQVASANDDLITLSPELSEIAADLNQLKQESLANARAAKEAENRKSDLIMYLAHDLKTPLASVIGYLQLLRDEPALPEEARTRYLTTTLRKAERLDTLTNEFFEITRFNLSEIPLAPQRMDLSLLLEQLVFEAQPQLAEKNLTAALHTPEQLPLRADPAGLSRVFDNLLRNAILYSWPDTEIDITATADDERATIRFTNQGDTIPPEKLARLFEQFFRLDASRATSGGAGLGLAIARAITRQHGGDIIAESANDRVTFTVTLPTGM